MELVLVLPVVVLALLLVIQIGVIARDQVLVVNAAREGARAAALDGAGSASGAASASPGLQADRVDVSASVEASGSGDLFRVEVSYRAPTDVPLVGALMGDPTLAAVVVMRAEDPSP